MIQANEIRVGNLVFELETVTVTSIGKTGINEDEKGAVIPFDMLCGIPLTPEYLQAFGFEKDDDSEWGGWLSPEYDGEQYRIREGATFYFSIGTLHTPISVKYVHQLQNWYFVVTTGTELTINIEQVKV